MGQTSGRYMRRAARRRRGEITPVRTSPKAARKDDAAPVLASPNSRLGREQRAFYGIRDR